MPTVDLSGVSTEFTPIDAGPYDAQFTNFKNGVGATSGQPKVTLEFTITDGEFEGRKVFTDCSLQSHALFALKRNLLAFGADPEDLEGSIDTDEVLANLRGSRVKLRVSLDQVQKRDGTFGPANKIQEVSAY